MEPSDIEHLYTSLRNLTLVPAYSIQCAAYVANLAAFLTRSVPNYIGSMEAAVANGKSICALPVMRTAMEAAYPNARFVFSEVENSYLVMLDDYKAKKVRYYLPSLCLQFTQFTS